MERKRLFDIVAASLLLTVVSPLLVLCVVGVRSTSPGPAIYRAQRVGRGGRIFTMHKFRTMRHRAAGKAGSSITGAADARVYPFGALLRRLKLDEVPQLIDVLRGEMSIVGPRPEDPAIVADEYDGRQRATLTVRPGLTSPGALYAYTHGDRYLDDADPEGSYVRRLLPMKLELELVYVERVSLAYDVNVILRTVWAIIATGLGRHVFPDPPEMAAIGREHPARAGDHGPGRNSSQLFV